MTRALLVLTLVLGIAGCRAEDTPGVQRSALQGFVDGSFNGRNYKLYVPSGYTGAPIPLVLMLHGCSQTPSDFATGTQMNLQAEAATFFALYPEQPSSKNQGQCWNWFDTASQARGSGEPSELVAIIDHVAATYLVDNTRVYAAGLSAGGAMAVILGATYPDRFAAITVGSGLEYKAATSLSAALNAQSSGGPSPTTQGSAAKTAMGSFARTVRVLVIHGSSDTTVAPVNGDQVIAQWAQTDDLASDGVDDGNIDDVADATDSASVPGGRSATRTSYTNTTTGEVVLQKIVVAGMNHAWSGGSASGSFTDPMGPDATKLSWAFFSAGQPTASDAGTMDDFAINPGDASQAGGDGAAIAGDGGALDGSTATPSESSGCAFGGRPRESAASLFFALALFGLARPTRRTPRSNS